MWEGVFAIEKNADAFKTLEHNLIKEKKHFNFPSWLNQENHDINQVLKNKELKKLSWKIDLVAWGPPCQGFSLAGRRDANDIRNTLVYSYLEFIKIVQPKVIFFENVKWFCAPFLGKENNSWTAYSKIVIDELIAMGYEDACFEILDFSDFWVWQSRERVIIVATKKWNAKEFFKNIKKNRTNFLNGKNINPNNSLADVIWDLSKRNGIINSPDTRGFKAGKYGDPLTLFQKYIRSWYEWKYPDSHRFANHKKETQQKFKTVIKEQLNSKQIQERFNTKKSSTRVLKSTLPSPTLTTLPDDLVHYSEPRILTVREYARIQSFPDSYIFKWKYTTWWPQRKFEVPRYTQIGNAIPPLFAEQAGLPLYNLIQD